MATFVQSTRVLAALFILLCFSSTKCKVYGNYFRFGNFSMDAFNPTNGSFPCESECAVHQICFHSGWREAMRVASAVTKGCKYALYSNSIGDEVEGIFNIQNYWENGANCSIIFFKQEEQIC
jgi:hypothetical protein